MRYDRILHTALSSPWSIEEDQLRVMLRLFARRAAGVSASDEEIQAAVDTRRDPMVQVVNRVAVLPLYGAIFPKSNLMTQASGATAIGSWIDTFEALAADPDVAAIVLDVDSPGGSTAGITEAAARMRPAVEGKPVVAVSNFLCASAAYWIAAQADQIVAAPSSMTGSIGVIAIHESIAAALEAEGVDVTIISAGKFKAEGNPYEELDPEATAELQRVVDEFYAQFVTAVAQGRGVSESDVRSGFGQGRALPASRAMAEGLVDRIDTIQTVVSQLQSPQRRSAMLRRRAQDDAPAVAWAKEQLADDVPTNVHTNVTTPTPSPEDIAAALERRMKEPIHA